MRPFLSVIIPSHNRADLLHACLSSVERHAPAGTEVVVVDDASPEGCATEAAQRFADVRVIRLERQSGFAVAANTGIRAARHPVVEMLNDDTEVTAGWAEAALDHFNGASVAAVAPLVLRWRDKSVRPTGNLGGRDTLVPLSDKNVGPTPPPDTLVGPRIDSAGDRYFLGGVAGKRGHGELLRPEYQRSCPVFGASASSAFYRRDAFLAVGGFPEHFGAYFEDVDLSFRLNRAGYRTVYEPASCLWHHVSASYGSPRDGLLEQQSRNEELVFWRNLPAGTLIRALPLHFAVLAAKAWRRWREGNLLQFVRGRLRVLGEIDAIRRHRQHLLSLGAGNVAAWSVESRFWEHDARLSP